MPAKKKGGSKVPARICPHCEKKIPAGDKTIMCPQCERVFHFHCGFEEKICHFCKGAVEGEDVDFKPELDEADEEMDLKPGRK